MFGFYYHADNFSVCEVVFMCSMKTFFFEYKLLFIVVINVVNKWYGYNVL